VSAIVNADTASTVSWVSLPPDDAVMAQIADPSQEQFALVGRELGEIRDPSFVRAAGDEIAVQQVLGRVAIVAVTFPFPACVGPL
jgi:hypothetical protein